MAPKYCVPMQSYHVLTVSYSIYTLVLFCVATGLGFMYYIILCLTKKYVNVLYAADRWVTSRFCQCVKLHCTFTATKQTSSCYFISIAGVRADSATSFRRRPLSCRAMDTLMGQQMTHRGRRLWGENSSTMVDGWLARHTRAITNTGKLWIIWNYALL